METHLRLDDSLVGEALLLSGVKTKREVVTLALQEFVTKRRQTQFLKLEGTFDFDPNCDYREQRNRT